MDSKLIVITGGHHTPAFAVVAEITKHYPDIQVLWLGHKYSLQGAKKVSAEYLEVLARGYLFVNLRAGKFFRVFNPFRLLLIPAGFCHSLYLLLKYRPCLVISFGGYLAVPVVVAAWLLRLPIVTHEQTTTIGIANRVVSRFSQITFLAWRESQKYLGKKNGVVVGNPVREQIFISTTTLKQQFTSGFQAGLPIVYITGGKQGSHKINLAVAECLSELVTRYNVLHQCGNYDKYADFASLSKRRQELPTQLRQRYYLQEYFPEEQIGTVYSLAEIVVSRAGANTVYELALLGKVALFIPLPYVPNNEQYQNALVLKTLGSAHILDNQDLSGRQLLLSLRELERDYPMMKQQADKHIGEFKRDSAAQIVQELAHKFPKVFPSENNA